MFDGPIPIFYTRCQSIYLCNAIITANSCLGQISGKSIYLFCTKNISESSFALFIISEKSLKQSLKLHKYMQRSSTNVGETGAIFYLTILQNELGASFVDYG